MTAAKRSLARLIVFVMFMATLATAKAQDNLSLEEHLQVPEVPQRRHGDVADRAGKLAAQLQRRGMRTATLRNGEVVLATLPCDTIFAANSAEPKREGLKRLQGMQDIVRNPERYKVLVAVHTDNTGDSVYSDELSLARAQAVDEMLWQMGGGEDTNVVIYGMGKDEPLNDNATRQQRRANRRIEFYIVPLDI
ncbi:MAG: OmpA family protein [Muribaculaceae bacterium]|nr:OmpA family protein [Muribaculaceae bacterium]